MLSRKSFLSRSLFAAAAGMSGMSFAAGTRRNANPHSSSGYPLVIATWDNRKATEAGMDAIKNGGTALDAVEAGARVPEADPDDRSVGYGGRPDRDGFVTLDACIMDAKGNAGAVSYLQDIMHAVSVARKVMEETPHVTLSGDGALQFALAQGFKKTKMLTGKSKQDWEKWKQTAVYKYGDTRSHDTIGILALDDKGDIGGACTTSGLAYKMHGRVGDSPVIGAGMYVDNDTGGACATGVGELVLKTLGSFLIVELMRNGRTPQEACEEAIHRILKKYDTGTSQVGYLAIDKKGEHGAFSIKPTFPYALFQNGENRLLEAGSMNAR